MSRAARASGLVLLTAALFSTGGAAVKATELGAWQVAGLRSAVAAIALLVLLPQSRGWWRPRNLAVGVAYAATLVTFVHANKLTTAASTIFLQATAPLYLMALGPLLLREPLRRRDLRAAPLFALGLVLVFVGLDPPSETAPWPRLGNAIAAASGLCYALTILGLRTLGRRPDPVAAPGPRRDPSLGAVVAGNGIAAAVCLPVGLPMAPDAVDLGVVLYLGVFQIGLAYALLTRAVTELGALEVSLLLLLEPVLSPVWAALVVGEVPGLLSWVGGALVLGATVLQALGRRDAPASG
ncbi:MAG TPA: DMT family transporter [Thermoanaerobaculia bacterium]|nr:DMT family transporter [Thermoanaerobaculia bacterium]